MNNTEKSKRKRESLRRFISPSLRRFVSPSLCLIVIWIFLAPFSAWFLVVEKPVEKAEAIWVLGGSAAYLERTQKAAEVYRQGISDKIFVIDDGVHGGWNDGEKRNLPFYEISKRELVTDGVNENAIEIVKPIGDGTVYEAKLFAEKNTNNHIKSLLLVTSPYHTRRALWTFQHFNPNITVSVISPEISEQTPTIYFWWLSSTGWSVVFGEYVKFIYYWLYY